MKDITPTTKIIWFNQTDKDLWEPRIERVRKTYNDAELATMATGMRRVFVYHINSTRFDESYEFLRKNKLVYYPTNKSGLYSGFSHRHTPVKEDTPYMLYGAAVRADDEEAGELFMEYSKNGNHVGIGELLGYPECCSTWFKETWGTVSVDPIYEAAVNTPEADADDVDMDVTAKCHPYCNNMLRYFSIRITPHLTHSLQCENTIEWGNEWIEIMRQIDEEATEWAVELLSMPMTWDCLKGVAIIDTPIFRGVTNSDTTLEKKVVKSMGWKS